MNIAHKMIASLCVELRNQGKHIVFTNGCFDILHAGHVTYLQEAKKLGNFLIIGLNSDDSVRRLKGESRPINNEADRALVLEALRAVDFVFIFEEDTPLELITQIKPDVLVKGGDYDPNAVSGPRSIVGADFVRSYGGKVAVIPFVAGKSTTGIIQKVAASKTEAM